MPGDFVENDLAELFDDSEFGVKVQFLSPAGVSEKTVLLDEPDGMVFEDVRQSDRSLTVRMSDFVDEGGLSEEHQFEIAGTIYRVKEVTRSDDGALGNVRLGKA